MQKSVVEKTDLANEQAIGPSIAHDVMEREHEDVLFRTQLQRTVRKIGASAMESAARLRRSFPVQPAPDVFPPGHFSSR